MLNYRKECTGKREWVVFLHGLGGSINTWKKQIEDFKRYYNIIILDLNSHGGSKEKKLLKYDNYKYVCDSIKEVIDYEGIKKSNFVCMSLGTLVMLDYLRFYPQTVDKVVMGGGVLDIGFNCLFLLNIVQGIKYIIPKKYLYFIFSNVVMPGKTHKKSRDIFNKEVEKVDNTEFKKWLQTLKVLKHKNKDIDTLKRCEKKILYVSGSNDYMFIKGVVRGVIGLDDVTLRIIESCGHVCTIEKYIEFNGLALSFLGEKT